MRERAQDERAAGSRRLGGRERLERHGAGALADEELPAILSLVHPREVFRTAATHCAAAIVPFHYHPYRVTPLPASTTSP